MFLSSQNRVGPRIIFLDRDGVINRDSSEYIKSWAEFQFLPRSIEALRVLKQHRFKVFVVTNQSAVGRGLITRGELLQMHAKMMTEIEAGGGLIQDIFFCPHLPQDRCGCRKPEPGLILAAHRKYSLALSQAYLVGDSAEDIECASRANCGNAILVKTGNSSQAERSLAAINLAPAHIAPDLFAAVTWIIGHL
jgi:D-glycero-D-manno-heptose 1,7-bisphosphate phosphatase